jgi:hypothetical protein
MNIKQEFVHSRQNVALQFEGWGSLSTLQGTKLPCYDKVHNALALTGLIAGCSKHGKERTEEEFLDQINDYQLLNNCYPLWRWFDYYYWYLAGKSALKACTYLRAVTAYVHISR